MMSCITPGNCSVKSQPVASISLADKRVREQLLFSQSYSKSFR